MPSIETAARSLKVVPISAPIRSDAEIEAAITAFGREPGGGFVVITEVFAVAHRAPIILAAARNNAPFCPTPDHGAVDHRSVLSDYLAQAASAVRRPASLPPGSPDSV